MPPFVVTETRAGQQFQNYWSGLPRAGLVPHSRDFLTAPHPSQISRVTILELVDNALLVRFMGTTLVSLIGEDHTNKIFGEGLPEDLRQMLFSNCQNVVSQPCGLYEITEFISMTGRPFLMETLLMPLAVDGGRPPRLCSFSAVLEEVDADTSDAPRYKDKKNATWFDIGAGCPADPPLYRSR